jgi:DNA-binding transcriptional MerR regulator
MYLLNLDERLIPFRKRITERKYTAKNIESTYRMVNHWAKLGIIESAQTEPSGWRKFSIVDMVWLDTIGELRKYGMSLEKLKKFYDGFYKSPYPPHNPEPRFEYSVFLALAGNPVFVVVYESGFATTVGASDSLETLWKMGEFIEKQSYVMINLNSIVNKLFKRTDNSPRFPDIPSLTDKESSILALLRQREYEEVKIVFRDKEPLLFEGREKLKNDSRLGEILRDQDYQTVEVKTEQGKVVKFERVVKKKI